MPNPVRVLSIDFETASTADLRRTGAHTYAEDPSTRVLCMAWAFDNDSVQVWRPGQLWPYRVTAHVRNMRPVRAWNAAFELAIWDNVLARHLLPTEYEPLSIAQVRDTMAQAAYYGLPLGLDMAGAAAGVNVTKSKTGHALMLRMCRPRGFDQITGAPLWWHETDPQKYQELCDYCAQDVEVERAIANVLPDLPPRELAIWQLDQRMNTRGVGVDYDLVQNLKVLALEAAADTNNQMFQATSGLVKTVTSTAGLLGFLQGLGSPVTDLQKATVAERLDDPTCVGLERELLELRADGAKTSAAKLDAMLSASVARAGVGQVRGMLQYYGAFRTGRWAGRLIQLQNLPSRGILKGTTLDAAITSVQRRTPLAISQLMFGPGLKTVSSLLRSCIVPSRADRGIVAADSMQIEARVLPWLAGQEDVLDVFRSGGDVYVKAGAGIFGRTFPAGHKFVKKDIPGEERDIGKVAILALGFGGGKGAFKTMAAAYGMDVGDTRAEEIKVAWRADNPKTVQLWWDLDRACRAAIKHGGIHAAGAYLKVGMWGPHMVIVLPSTRGLFYRNAKLEPNGDTGKDDITYMGMNQYTRKWERIRTYGGKLAENVTQATARDVLADAMLHPYQTSFTPTLTVHDELIGEADLSDADNALAELVAAMSRTPAWAPGLPVGADGWHGPRYKKG